MASRNTHLEDKLEQAQKNDFYPEIGLSTHPRSGYPRRISLGSSGIDTLEAQCM